MYFLLLFSLTPNFGCNSFPFILMAKYLGIKDYILDQTWNGLLNFTENCQLL